MDDSLPFDGWPLKIDQKTETPARGAQVVQALSAMLGRQAFDAFQFDHQHVFDKDIGVIFSHILALVSNGEGSLGDGLNTEEAQFFQECALVNLLEETGSKRVGNLKNGAEYTLCQGIEKSAFIGVHQRSISLWFGQPKNLNKNQGTLMNADKRGYFGRIYFSETIY